MSAVDNKKVSDLKNMDFYKFLSEPMRKANATATKGGPPADSHSLSQPLRLYSNDNYINSDAGPSKKKPNFEEDCDADPEANLNPYMANALEVIEFRIDYDGEQCLEVAAPFKPTMAHQIFGYRERILGYRNLQIKFDILPNSFHTRIRILSSSIYSNPLRGEISDDILIKLSDWFPHIISTNEEYENLKRAEDCSTMFGQKLVEIKDSDTDEVEYIITMCDVNEPGFLPFHKRFQALIVFYIDAASVIQFADRNWMYFYLYKRIALPDSSAVIMPVGFCTVYNFKMSYRSRLSQLFILPNFQKKGLGTRLLGTVFNHFTLIPKVQYLTVESPCPEFTVMRDKLDLRLLIQHPLFQKASILQGFTEEMEETAQTLYKICPSQIRHLYYILRYFYTKDNSAQRKIFMDYMKKESYLTYKRKLVKIHNNPNKISKIARIKKILKENCLVNNQIDKDVRLFLRSIRSQVAHLDKLYEH